MNSNDIEFRLIVDDPADGQWNMAVDETLLEVVGSGEGFPVIRLYGFEPATLSVGRFQPTPGIVDFDRVHSDGKRFVRRPSGGQAVLHTDELTYAFVIGKNHLEPFGKRWVYRFIAPLLMAGLERVGLTEIRTSQAQKGDPLNPDCFGSTGEYEIDSAAGRKLVGSAQMITRTSVLQHGSIPLSSKNREIGRYLSIVDDSASHASNLESEMGRYADFASVRAAFVGALSDRLKVKPDRLGERERARAQTLLEEKYSTDEWNRKY
ncbi:MAG TPA: biotin/lipoate A/B protein ligase family protein [Spirochaetia bacterium]|nr:biotin/lipoate A/B protein ligase family protein [Spirochaetia bacterium]